MSRDDPKSRVEEARRCDVPGFHEGNRVPACRCPTCGMAELVLRSVLRLQGDVQRITIRASACGDGSYPFLASVRVDGREVYRIMNSPDEVFQTDVLEDITAALRRPV
jgi:hypothetical protein